MDVLDTNVISELRQGKPNQSPEVRAWAASVPAQEFNCSTRSRSKPCLRIPPHPAMMQALLTGKIRLI